MLKKFPIFDFIKYHYLKIFRYFSKKFTSIFLLYFKNNLPQNLIDVMKNNRQFLKSVSEFIPEHEYDAEENNYGIQYHIYTNLKKDIDLFPTNTDILIYLIYQLGLTNLNYLEIGTSVFKNFQQVENSISESTLYAYDINDPVSVIKEKYKFREEIDEKSGQKYLHSNIDNEIIYFKNDVLSKEGATVFQNLIKQKIDIVFSDALHSEEGILSEYDNIIKDNLSSSFIYYFDDLNMYDVQSGVEKIYNDLNKNKNNVNFYTFWSYGWIGQHERLHKIGLITSYDISEIFKLNKLKLPFFRKIESL